MGDRPPARTRIGVPALVITAVYTLVAIPAEAASANVVARNVCLIVAVSASPLSEQLAETNRLSVVLAYFSSFVWTFRSIDR